MKKLVCFRCGAPYLKDEDEIGELIELINSIAAEDFCENCVENDDWQKENSDTEKIRDDSQDQ